MGSRIDSEVSPDTPEVVRDLEQRCRRHETPCGEGTLVWRSWGTGKPLVLLHGSHGSWLHWVRNIEAFEGSRQVIVPDLPGYGESAPPPDVDSLDSHAEALAAGLRLLLPAEDPVDIVGFSLGGLLGAHLAALAPGLVRRLVVIGSGGLDTPMPEVHLRIRPQRGLTGEELREARRHNLAAMMLHHLDNVDDLALWIDANTARPTSRAHYQVLPDKLLLVLPRTTTQVDALWGEHDGLHPGPELNAAVLRELHPGLELRTVPGVGHWCMYEGAADFNRHLRELLELPLRTVKTRV